MQKYVFFGLLFQLISFCHVKTEFIKLDWTTLPTNQKLYLFGDMHGRSSINVLNIVHNLMEQAEQETSPVFHFLVEKYFDTEFTKQFFKRNYPDVLRDLSLIYVIGRYQNSTVQDIDCRKKLNAAARILTVGDGFKRMSVHDWFNEFTKCLDSGDYRTLTFKDVFNAFAEIGRRILTEYRPQWISDEKIYETFTKAYDEAADNLLRLHSLLRDNEISIEKPIIDIACEWHSKYQVTTYSDGAWFRPLGTAFIRGDDEAMPYRKVFEEIISCVCRMGSIFMELNTFHNILLLQKSNVKKIVVFVGDEHRKNIKKLLIAAGFYFDKKSKIFHEYTFDQYGQREYKETGSRAVPPLPIEAYLKLEA